MGYYENNRAYVRSRQKEYYEQHKASLKRKGYVRVLCECGYVYRKMHRDIHKKTLRHQGYLSKVAYINRKT